METHTVRVAAWQGPCLGGDVAANGAVVHRVIGEAAEKGVDFLCFPETFLSGYGTKEMVARGALALDDPRLTEIARRAGDAGLVLLLGLAERDEDGRLFNTIAVYDGGERIGTYRKSQRTGGDVAMGFGADYELPVFHARGICFGCIVCHDSSFLEPAATLAYRGAEVIFSPHYNAIPFGHMDAHRLHVRNNHVGLAALLGVFVLRANVVGKDTIVDGDLGYGDSAVFGPDGVPLAEAGLFTERLLFADLDPAQARKMRWKRDNVPSELHQALAAAQALYRREKDPPA